MGSRYQLISIVIPAYNEQNRLPATLDKIETWRNSSSIATDLIIVDDGSSDNTAAIVENFRSSRPWVKLISYPLNRGKGYAVKCGAVNALDAVLIYDADGSTPIEELSRLIPELEKGADVVIGSRALPSADTTLETELHRRLFGRIFNFVINLIIVPDIYDTQCGFKLFSQKAAQKLFRLQRSEGFSFDIELLYLARKFGFRIEEVGVNWHHEDGSKVHLFRDGPRMVIDAIKLRLT